jgi:adenylate cyclase
MKPVPPATSFAEEAPREPGRSARLSRSDDIAVLEALDAIIASGALGGGERLPALLRYLVTEEPAGRGERIKAFAIATEVLGRGADFDPQLDSIARTEMARLRKAFDHVTAPNSDDGQVRITIPKGSYRPRIDLSAPEEPEADPENGSAIPLAETARPPRRWLWADIVLAMLPATGLALLALPVWQDTG